MIRHFTKRFGRLTNTRSLSTITRSRIDGYNGYNGYNGMQNGVQNENDYANILSANNNNNVYIMNDNKKLGKMKEIKNILLLSNAFNSMTQSFWLFLIDNGYNVHFETVNDEEDIANIYDRKVVNGPNSFNYDLILCPFLTKKIPSELYDDNSNSSKKPKVLIVHPGIAGDRGISSIDWRLLDGYNSNSGDGNYWGVSILETHNEMDHGDIWSTNNFDMLRSNTNYKFTKSNLYQKEVINAALIGLEDTLNKMKHNIAPEALNYDNDDVKGTLRPTMKLKDRQFEWKWNATKICQHIDASSSRNGVLTEINGTEYFVYDAHIENKITISNKLLIEAGTVLGYKNDSILISTGTKPIWITTLKKRGKTEIKLPATMVLDHLDLLPNYNNLTSSYNDIYYKIKNDIIYLHFDFFNGAFDTNKCIRLQLILNEIASLKQEIVVLMGGYQYFGNGINLNTIENAKDSEVESFRNINGINNIIQTIFTSFADKLVISAVHGNCGAGGVMLALCADIIWSHKNVIFNPHYKLMGLHGSEYWTEFLSKRIGSYNANKLTDLALPISAKFALKLGLIDEIIGDSTEDFRDNLFEKLNELNKTQSFLKSLKQKYKKEKHDINWIKKAENHRCNEMSNMLENFQSEQYKVNRHNFVHKIYRKKVVTNDCAQKLLSMIYNNNNNIHNIDYPVTCTTNILHGKDLSNSIERELKENICDFKNMYNRIPKLVIICVGFDDNLDLYTRNKIRSAKKIGMEAELLKLNENITSFDTLSRRINDLNNDDFVDGIIVQLPLPQHLNYRTNEIMNLISPYKDVDGLTMYSNNKLKQDANNNCNQLQQQLDIGNYFKFNIDDNYINIPCVPFGIMKGLNSFQSLQDFNDSLQGKNATIIGNSDIIGKPMTEILLSKNMTVTCTHKYTKYLSNITCQSDLVITATGSPHLIKKDWVKNGSVIFDVGICYDQKTNQLCGDVDIDGLINYVHAITPVPGGIGPLTVSSVLSNTINSAKWRQLYQTKNNEQNNINHVANQIAVIFNGSNDHFI